MFILLTGFLKSFFGCFEEKRLIELTNCSAHDSISKLVTFDFRCSESSQDIEVTSFDANWNGLRF